MLRGLSPPSECALTGVQRKTPVVDINRGSLFRQAKPYQKLAGTESACGDDAGVALRPETS
jgi:hypothetical protein